MNKTQKLNIVRKFIAFKYFFGLCWKNITQIKKEENSLTIINDNHRKYTVN